jgi:hypothetical protein
MKPTITPLKPALEREMLKVVEEFAAVELKPDVVRLRIFDAAKKGQAALRLRLPDRIAIDVRRTGAAQELESWCRTNDLQITWESRMVETEDGRRVNVWEPEISW